MIPVSGEEYMALAIRQATKLKLSGKDALALLILPFFVIWATGMVAYLGIVGGIARCRGRV